MRRCAGPSPRSACETSQWISVHRLVCRLIAGVTALIGAALSLLLIRARDLHLDAHEESGVVHEPDAGDEQPALAA